MGVSDGHNGLHHGYGVHDRSVVDDRGMVDHGMGDDWMGDQLGGGMVDNVAVEMSAKRHANGGLLVYVWN